MIFLPKGGVVIDTPGMREFHLWGASEGAKESFPEIEALAAGCRFRDRCPFAFDRCAEEPPFMEVKPGHSVACWLRTKGAAPAGGAEPC